MNNKLNYNLISGV